jgi:mutator protein MutT
MITKTCSLLFLIRDNEILLAMKKRGFGSNRYNGVGGKVEPGETIEQAVIRECQEEIGVTPTRFHKVAEHNFYQHEEPNPWHMNVHAYIADTWEGEPIETDEMAPEWFKLNDIPYDNMWQDDRYWIPYVLEGKKVKGLFTFDEKDTLLTHKVDIVEQLYES